MSGFTSTWRRAPARVTASIMAITLAVAAMGVFAVPTVASDALRELAAADRLSHVSVDVTPIESTDALALTDAEAVEGRISTTVRTGEGELRLVGLDFAQQQVDVVRADVGRLPTTGEVLVSPGVATVGDTLTVAGTPVAVVGEGTTAWWAGEAVIYAPLADARALTAIDGVNRLLVRVDDPEEATLDAVVAELRSELADEGAAFRSFPVTVPDGRHPIENDMTQISTMIGLLGVVAGVVALVLLASTTNTLVTERTRDVAVMRALGARRRFLRRRLRRLAITIAALGAAMGIPLGIVVANVIARTVLTRFAGITPAFGISWAVVAASVVFALLGARLVAGRAARRITGLPLAEALRDREGSPYGRRWSERLVAHVPTGGLFERMALRAGLHRRARSLAVTTQLAVGVAAVITVASLGTSVVAFNEAELEPWAWKTTVVAPDSGLPFDAAAADEVPGVETAIRVDGSVGDWEVDVYGLEPTTVMLDRTVRAGSWLDGSTGVVIAAGFADSQGIEIGDTVTVELASGSEAYEVRGLHASRSRDLYLDRDVLAAALGTPGRANLFWTDQPSSAVGPRLAGLIDSPVDVVTLEQAQAEDAAARDLILRIFWTIGAVVVGVAALGVASAMAVNVYERRHEHAALQAIGGDRSSLRRLLVSELVPLALVASAIGVVAGWFASAAIMGFFETANAVEIGAVFAAGSVPIAVAGSLLLVGAIAVGAARAAARRPVAATLRGAA